MNSRDYMSAWVSPEGAEYRKAVYERQRAGGSKPLVDNPTVEEIRDALLAYSPQDVLEVGCGWGRLIGPLRQWFKVVGCDVSKEMLDASIDRIRIYTFQHDITSAWKWNGYYDCVFCRGVMMFIPPEKLEQAMRNMEALACKKVLVWEWSDVCALMQKTYKSDRFEYHAIEVRDE
jgi:SAM-dependent methyltransferase